MSQKPKQKPTAEKPAQKPTTAQKPPADKGKKKGKK